MRPSTLAPGGEGTITVKAVNIGDGPTSGAVRLSDVLPPHLKILEEEVEGVMVPRVRFLAFSILQGQFNLGPAGPASGAKLCEAKGSELVGSEVACTTGEVVPAVTPYEDLEMQIAVKDEGVASNNEDRATVAGGQALAVTATREIAVSSTPPAFGVEDFAMTPEEEGGSVDAQAGSHPFQLSTTLALNQTANPVKPPALARNLTFQLPAGMVGNTTALPKCSDLDFRNVINRTGTANSCSSDTVIGVASVTVDEPETLGLTTLPVPLFNLEPGSGEPARFGFEFSGTPVTLDTAVRTGEDYGVTVKVSDVTQLTSFLSSTVTFWGVPGDPRHDESRGWGCLVNHHWGEAAKLPCETPHQTHPKPFLTLPTACDTPFAATVTGESWPLKSSPAADPAIVPLPQASYSLVDGFGRELQMTGCNQLPFAASIDVQPDTQRTSSPSGLTVHVRVPQEASEASEGLAGSAVKDITVSLPEGVTLNSASAGGLEACSEAQIGYLREQPGTHRQLFNADAPSCPAASKVGTTEVISPLLPATQHLLGSVYLAAQGANPFSSLLAMYIVAEDPLSGVLVKLAGKVTLDETSGRVTTTLTDNPQLPFSEAILKFFGGPRAPLLTPALCRNAGEGGYETFASFTPWSANEALSSSSAFEILAGPGGAACPNAPGVQSPTVLPFAPTLAAGTTNTHAGGFTPLTTTISRADGNQALRTIELHTPPGFAAMISSVTPCPDQQASEGTCSSASLIGHTVVSVGLGGEPFRVTGGQVFITGPYQGAPFGLSIASPAKGGPFDLGKGACDCIVVRAKLQIDPHTAEVTVSTDPGGPYAIPQMLDGIPLQISHISATIDRANFAFNPTNCEPFSITAQLQSFLGAVAVASTPFQIANCATLKFAPKFSVTTDGRTSKVRGASLTTKVVYPNAAVGTQANIAKVKVELPKQLPSRLTTLQKACLARVFDANPANCPSHSIVGHAKVITPVLPVPLSGPAYFVSHGGEAFPSLTIVLQGDNVTIDLVGSTFISKKGITSTTFKTVPDVPFNTFELKLPQGKFSALGANANLCKSKLAMPTEFVAQNGLKINETTKVAVTGCKKAHKATNKHGKKGRKGKRRRKK